jgi:hypothetical protein
LLDISAVHKHAPSDADEGQAASDGRLANAKILLDFRPRHELAVATIPTLAERLHTVDRPPAMSAREAGRRPTIFVHVETIMPISEVVHNCRCVAAWTLLGTVRGFSKIILSNLIIKGLS